MADKNTNTKFDFTKKDEKKKVELAESKKLDASNPTEAPVDDAKLINNVSEVKKDNKETAKTTEAKKAVVEYIGHGVWKDSNGDCWCRNEHEDVNILSKRIYTSEEFESRNDLAFMVSYGEMKVTLV